MEEPARVLQVVLSMNRGGVENMIMNLYRRMDRTQIQFDFLVFSKKEAAFDKEIQSLGGKLYRLDRFIVANPVSHYYKCRHFFMTHPEYRVVHGHLGSSAALYLLAAKQEGCFTIAHSHSANLNSLLLPIYRPVRLVADQFFACSSEAGISRFGKDILKKENYRNLPNALDVDRFAFDPKKRAVAKTRLGLSEEQLVIGTVGRFVEAKNPEYIYRVFQSVLQKDKKAVCLWVGGYGKIEQIKRQIEDAGLSDRILLTGVREDIPDLLQAMDAFVFPSRSEGLGLGAVEAQAAGLPVLLSDTIPNEAAVTSLSEWHSLRESPEAWAARALRLAEENRPVRNSPLEQIREKGYDIQDSVAWLSQFYLDKHREKERGN